MEQLTKGRIEVYAGGWPTLTLEFQFNPTEYTLEKSVQNAEINIPGLDSPLLQFIRCQNERLTMELFFDSTENGMGSGATSVTTLTDPFFSLVKIVPDDHAPPRIEVHWGDEMPGKHLNASTGGSQRRNYFTGVVESIRQKFTLFSPDGVPLRATLTLVIREYKNLWDQLWDLNLMSPDRTHSHVLCSGDTLSSIAARYYRKPGEWRSIAEANQIEDPRRMSAGVFLRIPPLP